MLGATQGCFSKVLLGEDSSQFEIADQGNKEFLNELLQEFPDVICNKIGLAKCNPYKIVKPAYKRAFHCPPDKQKVLQTIINDLLQKGIINKSMSQYSAPFILQPKK